ncbi:hypothetical protein ACLOJK_016464 [Asimina triloba]
MIHVAASARNASEPAFALLVLVYGNEPMNEHGFGLSARRRPIGRADASKAL